MRLSDWQVVGSSTFRVIPKTINNGGHCLLCLALSGSGWIWEGLDHPMASTLARHHCCSLFRNVRTLTLNLNIQRCTLAPFPLIILPLYYILILTSSHLNITVHENLGNHHSLCCPRDFVLNPPGLF